MEQQNKKDQSSQKGFEEQMNLLKEVYKNSTLKEKHRLNEHIKHLIKTYGEHDMEFIEKGLK